MTNVNVKRIQECNEYMDKTFDGFCEYDDHGYYVNVKSYLDAIFKKYPKTIIKIVIASYITNHYTDGRYSAENKKWATDFKLKHYVPYISHFHIHPASIDRIATVLRRV